LLLAFGVTPHLHGQVVITEFMASNSRTIADENGDYTDWIEIYNNSRAAVSMEGWYLTDVATNLTQWRFPKVDLSANAYLVIFASGKNRAVPGAPLHANFRLSSTGEFLALVKPDGVTIASSYGPQFLTQAPDISYGIALQQTVVPLISSGTAAKLLIPSNDALANGWTALEWDDFGWKGVTNGIGYDVSIDAAPLLVLVADSIAEFSARQSQDGWLYGYYNKTADRVAGFQSEDFIEFPRAEGAHGASNFWNGASWDMSPGDPPWTEIGPSFVRPNGINNTAEHWAIRRWVSKVSGAIQVEWTLAKQDPNGSGVTGRVLHNGTQKDIAIIDGDDVAGVKRTVSITGVAVGDSIDLALAPGGVRNSTDDVADGSFLSARIYSVGSFTNQIGANVGAAMRNINATAYVRIPFTVDDPSGFEFLTLRMRYDDGFVAYLNGLEVARRNAPETPAWNSSATAERPRTDVAAWEEINLSRNLGLVHVGTNLLALHGLNAGSSDTDFLLLTDLRATVSKVDLSAKRYFSVGTPGAMNGFGKTNLGPLILEVRHLPAIPADEQDLIVTAKLVSTFEAVKSVELRYRIMFSNEVSVAMFDNGLEGDGVAGDGVFGAKIPATASLPGQMIRYFVTASDASSDTSRSPAYADPKNSPQYHGTIVLDPTVTSALPIIHWFIQNPSSANNETGARCSVFYQGEFYDNISANLHGQSSEGFPKKSWDFDFNRGHHFRYDANERKVEDFNLLTTYPDKAHMRNLLAYETYRDAGSPYHYTFPVRVQQNGAFLCDSHWVEDGDEDFLARVGLDPRGALYKMYNTLDSSTTGAEKKTRKSENNADLQALITGIRRTGTARLQYIYDNIDIPGMVNYLATMIVTGGVDCCHKNYYAYRDTEGTAEWQYLPWDQDLTFGRNWTGAKTYFDDFMYTDNGLYVGSNNSLISALFATPSVKQMYLRRLRTLMDELLQPTNTPPAQLKYEKRINELSTLIAPTAALDFAKWPTWGVKQTLAEALDILTNRYMPARRNYLFRNREVPAAQTASAVVVFGDIEFNPASGNQAEEYIRITNTNSYGVDISGWKIVGALNHSFKPGTVLPTNSSIYVSPNVVAFRARQAGPRGAQGLFVQGNYQGQLSARGETLRLLDKTDREVAVHTYTGKPTFAQQFLRVTEVMYHPPTPALAGQYGPEDFEYLKLKNTSDVTLDLRGVRFTKGIQFAFATNQLNFLAAGESLFLVKNRAAFASRYGNSLAVAGEYVGSLDNSGEGLELYDAVGEKVLDFAYNNSWYPATDGQGYSLAVVNESAAWNAWGVKENWRASSASGGSAAAGDPKYSAWKAQHFTAAEQANPELSGDNADPDRDGYSNRQEFLCGTNPRDGSDRLQIGAAADGQSNAGFKIRFNGVAGKSYSVQYLDSLAAAGVWQKLTDVLNVSGPGLIEVSDPLANGTRRYYRVVTPMLP
jgi:hypothetical protein